MRKYYRQLYPGETVLPDWVEALPQTYSKHYQVWYKADTLIEEYHYWQYRQQLWYNYKGRQMLKEKGLVKE